jgi:hypothetical protein
MVAVSFSKKCFVCQKPVDQGNSTINKEFNLPVCNDCRGTDEEKKAIEELREGLAEGFVCGCI